MNDLEKAQAKREAKKAKRVAVAKKNGEELAKTEEVTEYYVVLGVIDYNSGAEYTNSLMVPEEEYQSVKKQINDKEPILLFTPTPEVTAKDTIQDQIAVNTDKYAFVSTKIKKISVFAKKLEVEGTGLVNLSGAPLKN